MQNVFAGFEITGVPQKKKEEEFACQSLS